MGCPGDLAEDGVVNGVIIDEKGHTNDVHR